MTACFRKTPNGRGPEEPRAIVPLMTACLHLKVCNRGIGVLVMPKPAVSRDETMDAMTALLRGKRGLKPAQCNTFYVTGQDRIMDLCVREALGATCGVIRWQFLVESATLTTLGAASGLLVGALMAWAVKANTKCPWLAVDRAERLCRSNRISYGGQRGGTNAGPSLTTRKSR